MWVVYLPLQHSQVNKRSIDACFDVNPITDFRLLSKTNTVNTPQDRLLMTHSTAAKEKQEISFPSKGLVKLLNSRRMTCHLHSHYHIFFPVRRLGEWLVHTREDFTHLLVWALYRSRCQNKEQTPQEERQLGCFISRRETVKQKVTPSLPCCYGTSCSHPLHELAGRIEKFKSTEKVSIITRTNKMVTVICSWYLQQTKMFFISDICRPMIRSCKHTYM